MFKELLRGDKKIDFKRLFHNFDNYSPEDVKNIIKYAKSIKQKIEPKIKEKLERRIFETINSYSNYSFYKAYAEYYKINIEEVDDHNSGSPETGCTNTECKPPCDGSCKIISDNADKFIAENPCPWSNIILFEEEKQTYQEKLKEFEDKLMTQISNIDLSCWLQWLF